MLKHACSKMLKTIKHSKILNDAKNAQKCLKCRKLLKNPQNQYTAIFRSVYISVMKGFCVSRRFQACNQ